MAKYARGKKSQAISDISGLRVPYTQLKTTWDGLRVSPEDYEPKQPQLTPAKNVIDATALFDPRPDNDPENVEIFIGFTQDWTIDRRLLPPVGVPAFASVGDVLISSGPDAVGAAGEGEIGTEAFEVTLTETGVAGVGAVGTITPTGVRGVSGAGGTGGVGVEALSLSIDEAGVGGTGAVGSESVEVLGWGQEGFGIAEWGD
tara:strand:- start:62 stop:667 length:606 start_codon:yes stop_codon:yes gene_type:complete